MMTGRVLEPEWLDVLPPGEASAQQSRRDLRTLNRLLGHKHKMVRLLRRAGVEQRGKRLIDLGCGDGRFSLSVLRELKWRSEPPNVLLVDRQPVLDPSIRAEVGNVELVTVDVFAFAQELTRVSGTYVMANLFLHHFTAEELRKLFALLAEKIDGFAACEPPRSRGAMIAVRLLRFIGCNRVTRHDAVVSVRAGFRDRELSELWPAGQWEVREGACKLFTHGFVASRP